FDPSRAPLVRLTLCRLAESEYRFVCDYHGLLLDSRSAHLLLDDLLSCYEALLNRQELPPRPKAVFQDYIAWLKNQDVEGGKRVWQAAANGLSAPTSVAVKQKDRGPSAEPAYARGHVCVSAKATEGLRRLAEDHRLNLDTIVRAAWCVLLSRYSGEKTVNFGATLSTRPPHMEDSRTLLGPFINPLPVPAIIAPDDSVLSLLKQLETSEARLRDYGYIPLWSAENSGQEPPDRYEFETNVEPVVPHSEGNAFQRSSLDVSDIHYS